MFAHRLIEPEILDHSEPEEARANLGDLVRINRFFGGHSTLRLSLDRVIRRDESFTLLDIGCASGDTARVVSEFFPNGRVTSLDYNAVNSERAPQPKLLADAFRLPFRDGSFDFVASTLFLHHFTDEQVTQLLSRAYAIARKGIVMVDLERHILPYLFLPASKPIYKWGRITVHDGIISVRAAFRKRELQQVADRAGIRGAVVRQHRPAFRLSLVAVK